MRFTVYSVPLVALVALPLYAAYHEWGLIKVILGLAAILLMRVATIMIIWQVATA